MHELNFCKSLCLPKSLDRYDCFGMDIIQEFPEAVLVPMAGIATPAQILYVSRPVMYKNEEVKILQTKDLDSEEKIDALYEDPEANILSPDHALDLDQRADIVFANRENSLKFIIDRLFHAGYARVAIWANNGIGKDARGEEEGVIRTDDGIAFETRLNGKLQQFYQRGMPESYQNTAHQHIHIAPVMEEGFDFDVRLYSVLESIHDWQEYESLEDYRAVIRKNNAKEYLPGISLCVMNAELDSLDKSLKFTHYPADTCFLFPQYIMSGLIRSVLLNFTKRYLKIDLAAPETKKEHLNRTKDFYQAILNS